MGARRRQLRPRPGTLPSASRLPRPRRRRRAPPPTAKLARCGGRARRHGGEAGAEAGVARGGRARRLPVAAAGLQHSISAKGRQSPAPAPDTLCLWICLFWTFPINGITHCVSFCVWLLSLSIVFSGIWCVVASLNMVSKSCLPTAPLGPSDKPGACLAQDKMPGLPCQYLSWEGHGYWAAQDTGSPPSGLCPAILHLLLWEDFTENPSNFWIPSLP
ncbi:uncharacterized protein LOC125964775 [Orcinus orca]|uniref:uncharacterized protein LOC125964775 n=1 Tax=Orcinus orca TaxID=9733 RepID=UPI0021133A48|nr:uncharacterized protein LOC125964775 [Orcinus orca]